MIKVDRPSQDELDDEKDPDRAPFFQRTANRINEIARELRGNEFSRKVWISDIADRLGMPVARLAPVLVRLQRMGLLVLHRRDLGGQHGNVQDKIDASEIRYADIATYHYVEAPEPSSDVNRTAIEMGKDVLSRRRRETPATIQIPRETTAELAAERWKKLEENPPRGVRRQDLVVRPLPASMPSIVVHQPSDAVQAFVPYIKLAEEHFVALFLNVRNRAIGYVDYTSGGIASVHIDVSSIIRAALVCGAVGVITAHQHPSGDPMPSSGDYAVWERLRRAAQTVGLTILDNLVLGEGMYFSEASEEQIHYTQSVWDLLDVEMREVRGLK